MFGKVVSLETERGSEVKWRFKALQHLVILHLKLGAYKEMIERYTEMLKYVGDVTRNECTDSINSILDAVSTCTDTDVVVKTYEVTLNSLKLASNERMWFNTNVKLAKVFLDSKDWAAAQRTIDEMHRSCQLPDGSDDTAQAGSLLEVYSLIVSYATITKNRALMKEVYPKITGLKTAVEDPRVMGGIREAGGKMFMEMHNWKSAFSEFYEGFRNYQEAGNSRAKDCLKYVVLANMLALSDINPFAAREAKVYQDEKEVAAMMDLRLAYEGNDLARFERTLRKKQNRIMDDPFIMGFIAPLRQRMREQVLLALVRPYEKVSLDFLAAELELSVKEVEELLVDLILNDRMEGLIDQINGCLNLSHAPVGGGGGAGNTKVFGAIDRWSEALSGLSKALSERIKQNS
ncbi:unnamed protein product [Chrysoparadoxa australica]